jgi:hypothetical protein
MFIYRNRKRLAHMKELLQSTVEQLRFHVMKNLELVRENEKQIKDMLKTPVTKSGAQLLAERYEFSKKTLSENNDFINLQLSIINFIYKYKHVWESERAVSCAEVAPVAVTREECFQMTVESKIEYDPNHPFYYDDNFYNNLLEFFQLQENYEKCDELVKKRV